MPPSVTIPAGLPVYIMVLFTEMCTLKSDKGMHIKKKDAKGCGSLIDLHPML
jgi:hypothetical protein